jgi:hypothetical protein
VARGKLFYRAKADELLRIDSATPRRCRPAAAILENQRGDPPESLHTRTPWMRAAPAISPAARASGTAAAAAAEIPIAQSEAADGVSAGPESLCSHFMATPSALVPS